MKHVHLTPPNNWMNDPNGFIYFQGKYHLFYQYFPYEPQWGTPHWGHAVSQDLVSWQDYGIALYPSKLDDASGCFSGSAVEYQGQMRLYYTGVHNLTPNPENVHQSLNDDFEPAQMLITSADGMTFNNLEDKQTLIPTLRDESIGHRVHTRDPKVWRDETGWYLIMGSSYQEKAGQVLIYHSEDGLDWAYVGKAMNPNLPGWGWECPDYFETEGGGVLLLSIMGYQKGPEGSEQHAIALPASFDPENKSMQLADQHQLLDYGMDLYAPQTTTDAQGRRIMVAWLRMPRPSAAGWIGMMSAPRLVERKGERIYFPLHPAIKDAYQVPIQSPEEARGGGYRIKAKLANGEQLNIGGYRLSRVDDCLVADRSQLKVSGAGFHPICSTEPLQDGEQVDILVDGHIIEVFANDGEAVITHAVYDLGSQISASDNLQFQLFTTALEQ